MSSFISRCPNCATLNRIPYVKLSESPNCGKCKSAIFEGGVFEGTEDNFDALINSSVPVVVDFWASWCNPCVGFAPVFESTASAWSSPLRFMKLDTEAQASIAARYGIRSIPTLKVFQHGKEVASISGALPKQQFEQWLTQSLAN